MTVDPAQMLKLLSPVHARRSVCLFQARLLEDEQKALHQQLQGTFARFLIFILFFFRFAPVAERSASTEQGIETKVTFAA